MSRRRFHYRITKGMHRGRFAALIEPLPDETLVKVKIRFGRHDARYRFIYIMPQDYLRELPRPKPKKQRKSSVKRSYKWRLAP